MAITFNSREVHYWNCGWEVAHKHPTREEARRCNGLMFYLRALAGLDVESSPRFGGKIAAARSKVFCYWDCGRGHQHPTPEAAETCVKWLAWKPVNVLIEYELGHRGIAALASLGILTIADLCREGGRKQVAEIVERKSRVMVLLSNNGLCLGRDPLRQVVMEGDDKWIYVSDVIW